MDLRPLLSQYDITITQLMRTGEFKSYSSLHQAIAGRRPVSKRLAKVVEEVSSRRIRASWLLGLEPIPDHLVAVPAAG